jgi:TIR domain
MRYAAGFFISSIVVAMVYGLIFSGVYQRVEIDGSLISLFVLLGLATTLVCSGAFRLAKAHLKPTFKKKPQSRSPLMGAARGGEMPDGSKQPVIFISYSHLDEPDPLLHPEADQWLTFITSHLKPSAAHGKLELWDDRRIEGGGNWRTEIDEALDRCAVCLFLVSRHSLSSRFILDVEMKRMLERHQAKGAVIYPIVITAVDLGAATWLRKLNLRPKNGTPLELYPPGQRNKVMSDLAAEIREIIERTSGGAAAENEPAETSSPMN